MPPYYHQTMLVLNKTNNDLLDAVVSAMGCTRTHLVNRAMNVLETTGNVSKALEWTHSDLLKYGSNNSRNAFQSNYKKFTDFSYRVGVKDKYDWITIKFESDYNQVINRRYIISKLVEYCLNYLWHPLMDMRVGYDD